MKLSGASYAATASGVSCDPSGGSVTVSGSFTGVGPVSGIGPSAQIYDSSGNMIGSNEAPLMLVNPGQTAPFNITVTTSGTPASCTVSWGAGPPPGYDLVSKFPAWHPTPTLPKPEIRHQITSTHGAILNEAQAIVDGPSLWWLWLSSLSSQ